MVNRDPNDLGLWADVGPHRITHAILAAVYGVLQVRGVTVFMEDESNVLSQARIL